MSFRLFIQEAIACAWLRPHDIVICDNSAIHQSGFNNNLSDWIWNAPALDGEPLRILLLPLPTQSPELNPIKLIWYVLVQRVKYGMKRGTEAHVIAKSAEYVLDTMDFKVMRRTCRHCGLNCYI